MRIALAAFTPNGITLLDQVRKSLYDCESANEAIPHSRGLAGSGPNSGSAAKALPQFSLFDKAAESIQGWLDREFRQADALVFVGATGLVVRLISGLLESKDKDPAVLVLDEKGRFVIPLLSGHIGGANRLARELASSLGAEAVITTATDLNGIFAIDEWAAQANCVIPDISQIKYISGALLRGEKAGFASDFPLEGDLPEGLEQLDNSFDSSSFPVGVCVSLDARKQPFEVTLNLLPRIGVLGAGCKKSTHPECFERFVLDVLTRQGINVRSLACLASIDLKREEPCMLDFALKYGLEFKVFDAESLNRVTGEFQASSFVQARTGVDNVCERAAVAAGGENLCVRKTSGNGVTLALGIPHWRCEF